MLSVLLATSLTFGFYEDPQVAVRDDAALELLARVSETRLVALNPSAHPQLLVFTAARGAVRTQVVLAAGDSLAFDYPSGTLQGLDLELVTRAENGLISSGELSLHSLVQAEFDLIWMESVGVRVHTWGELPTGPALIPPTRGSGTAFQPMSAPSVPAPHVPVITPTDKPKGDLPPRIEPEPLPPV
jgi:hypothetical protein